MQQGEGEDNNKKEMCIDIVEAKWLREDNHNKNTIQGEDNYNEEYQANRDKDKDKKIGTRRGKNDAIMARRRISLL